MWWVLDRTLDTKTPQQEVELLPSPLLVEKERRSQLQGKGLASQPSLASSPALVRKSILDGR